MRLQLVPQLPSTELRKRDLMPAGATYEPIASVNNTSSGSTVTFSSIPSTYTDLRLTNLFSTSGATFTIRFNSDTGTNYSLTLMQGDGTSATSSRTSNATNLSLGNFYDVGSSGSVFFSVDVFSYAGSTNKTCLITASDDLNGGGGDRVVRYVGLWRSTSAINSITISGSFRTCTTSLYGIKNSA